MKTILFPTLFIFLAFGIQAQNTDRDFMKAYNRINSVRILNLDKSDPVSYKKDSMEIVEINDLLQFYHKYLTDEHRLNGKAGFSFSGNENDINNLFRMGVNGSIDKGAYPYDVDFDLNILTTIQNGVFQENLSDIDVSFDFHPYIPKVDSKDDGLWLENYVFIKRFNNNFLGIQQRYEAGAGFIFNFYSKKNLTKRGQSNIAQLAKMPSYEGFDGDLKRCLEGCFTKESVLNISNDEIDAIVHTRERYKRSNFKKYSKFRLGLLLGLYYELENSVARNIIPLNGIPTLVEEDFAATNRLRWEARPSFVWQPKDNYKLKIYPYFKMPLGQYYSTVTQGDLVDSRYDYFIDIVSSLSIKIEKNFSISLNYRRLYDNAPKRKYIEQDDRSFILLVGQQTNSNYSISFNFGF